MVKMFEFEMLRVLIDSGLSNSEIGRRLGIDRRTVRKYRRSNSPPRYTERERATRDDPFSVFQADLEQWLAKDHNLSSTSVFRFLRDKGYQGSLRTVERRLAAWRSQQPKEVYFEQEYTLGEQSQVDFKEKFPVPFRDGIKICHIFIGTLPASGRFWGKGYPFKNFEAFADGVHCFFAAIGGMTDKLRFDNLTPVVRKILKGWDRIYTESFHRMLSYYDFKPLPCNPGKGSDKGDCERDIRTFSRRIQDMIILEGRVFTDFEDFNAWLARLSLAEMSPKQQDRFAQEINTLKPLPPPDNDILCKVTIVTAPKYGVLVLSGSRYSVPDHLIGRQVKAVTTAYEVKIYETTPRTTLVVIHPRKPEGENSILPEHMLTSLVRKPQAMVRWAHREILFARPIFRHYYSYLQKIMPLRAESEFLKSLNLIHHTTFDEIAIGMELVLAAKSREPFCDLKTLLLTAGHFPPAALEVLPQTPINPELSIYDSLISP